MPLERGARLGPYQIDAFIGDGGVRLKNRHMGSLFLMALAIAGVFLAQAPMAAQTQTIASETPPPPRTPWGAPDLGGIWDFRSATPLERPDELADREFYTDEEAAELEEHAVERLYADNAARAGSVAEFELWADMGTELAGHNRTSLVVDPPDGRIPRTTPGQERQDTLGAIWGRSADGPEDRTLSERCIMWTPTPLTPVFSNNNVQLFQTPDYVVMYHEMIHDVRVLPLDGRPHLDERIRQWRGDSRGYWDGDTLVVETTNFTDKTTFEGSGPNLRLVERFTRMDADTLRYAYTMDDPESFTRPWSVELPMTLSEGPVFEYACHEGNRGMVNILEIARGEERAAEEAAEAKPR